MPRRGVLSASRSPPAGAPGTGMAARRQAGNPLPPRARQSAQRRRMLRPDAAIPPMPPQMPKTISSVPDRSGHFISFPLLTVRQYVMGVRKGTLRMQSGFGSAQVRRPAKKPQSGSFQRQYPGSPPVFRRAPLGAMRQFGRSTELSFKKMRKYPAKKIEISFFLLYNHWVNEWRVCVNPVAGTARVFFLVPGELPPEKFISQSCGRNA